MALPFLHDATHAGPVVGARSGVAAGRDRQLFEVIMYIITPRNIRLELEAIEVKIKRDEKQKLHQPLKKTMSADAYASYISRRATS